MRIPPGARLRAMREPTLRIDIPKVAPQITGMACLPFLTVVTAEGHPGAIISSD